VKRLLDYFSSLAPKSRRLFLLAAGLLLLFGAVFLFNLSAGARIQEEITAIPAPSPDMEAVWKSIETNGLESILASLDKAQIKQLISRSGMEKLEPSSAKKLGQVLVERTIRTGKNPERQIASVLPSTSGVLAMLARDRDVDDYLEHASEEGPAGNYYQHVVDLVPAMKPLRSRYEGLLEGFVRGLDAAGRKKIALEASDAAALYKGGVTLPRQSSKPRESEYDYSHTFALDIFLQDVETLPLSGLEKGPLLFSLSDSIVLATSSNWRGGEELSEYHSGGITPKAGNGVILYSPGQRRYYLYFHLYDVSVSPGDYIPAGYPLGRGGNTGVNARKPGHGEHLHLEIYEASQSRFLKNYEIARIVFR